jgi:hypothetical protein
MLSRKSKLLLSLTVAAPILFAACVDNTLIGPYRDVAGTYRLTIFSGASVPVTFTYAAGRLRGLPNGGTATWTDGTMELNSNGTFTERNNYDYRDNGGAFGSDSFVSTGTFTLNGTDFTLSSPQVGQVAGRFATGTIQVDRINYVEQNFAFEYIR